MTDLRELLDAYIAALRRGVDRVQEPSDRNEFMAHLSAAGEMAHALGGGDFGRLAALLNHEERVLGWTQLQGPGGRQAHETFCELRRAELESRLRDRPDAW